MNDKLRAVLIMYDRVTMSLDEAKELLLPLGCAMQGPDCDGGYIFYSNVSTKMVLACWWSAYQPPNELVVNSALL